MDTRAKRRAETIRENSRLQAALAKKRCEYCGQRSWKVTSTQGTVRYLKCLGCQRTGKIALAPLKKKEEPTEAGAADQGPDPLGQESPAIPRKQ